MFDGAGGEVLSSAQKGDCVKKRHGKILLSVTIFVATLAEFASASIPFWKFSQENRDFACQPVERMESGEYREEMPWKA